MSSAVSRVSMPTSSPLHRDRVAAELHDRHLRGVAGAQRRLLEDQGHAPAVEAAARAGLLGQVDQVERARRARGRRSPGGGGSRALRSCGGVGVEDGGQDRDRFVDLVVGDEERRREPQGGRRDGVDDEPGVEAAAATTAGVEAVELGAEQQAEAPHVGDRGQGEPGPSVRTAPARRAHAGASIVAP